MRGEPLHGPSEEDIRAVRGAAGRRRTKRSGDEEDAALLRASADPRLAGPVRALAWLVWAYSCSPLALFMSWHDPPFGLDGLLPPILRPVAFLLVGRRIAAEHRAATAGADPGSSGWWGCLVYGTVWAGLVVAAYAVLT